MTKFYSLLVLIACYSCSNSSSDAKYVVSKSDTALVIDGIGDEAAWQSAEWQMMDQNWVGDAYSADDFSGKFKLTWDEDYLYVLAEIVDDTLIDIYSDPLVQYWDDDCLEIFIDEDASGGNHQYNHNAFAYHIALDGTVADMDVDKNPFLVNDHIVSKMLSNGNVHTWEVAMKIFDDTFQSDKSNEARKLVANKIMGFAIAYCDNDKSETRENFVGSEVVEGEDKNRGWIDAGIFSQLQLK